VQRLVEAVRPVLTLVRAFSYPGESCHIIADEPRRASLPFPSEDPRACPRAGAFASDAGGRSAWFAVRGVFRPRTV
jgi:hypothetical protein